MKQQIGTVGGVRRAMTKKAATADGRGFSWVPDGAEVADLVVYVDVAALVRAVGGKAIKSKSRVTKLQGGAVEIRAVNVRREVAQP